MVSFSFSIQSPYKRRQVSDDTKFGGRNNHKIPKMTPHNCAPHPEHLPEVLAIELQDCFVDVNDLAVHRKFQIRELRIIELLSHDLRQAPLRSALGKSNTLISYDDVMETADRSIFFLIRSRDRSYI